MTEKEYMLVTLMEEANELGKIVAKSLRFGLDSTYTGMTNEDEIILEYCHIISMMSMLVENGYIKSVEKEKLEEIIKNKNEKFNKFMNISRELGIVE